MSFCDPLTSTFASRKLGMVNLVTSVFLKSCIFFLKWVSTFRSILPRWTYQISSGNWGKNGHSNEELMADFIVLNRQIWITWKTNLNSRMLDEQSGTTRDKSTIDAVTGRINSLLFKVHLHLAFKLICKPSS